MDSMELNKLPSDLLNICKEYLEGYVLEEHIILDKEDGHILCLYDDKIYISNLSKINIISIFGEEKIVCDISNICAIYANKQKIYFLTTDEIIIKSLSNHETIRTNFKYDFQTKIITRNGALLNCRQYPYEIIDNEIYIIFYEKIDIFSCITGKLVRTLNILDFGVIFAICIDNDNLYMINDIGKYPNITTFITTINKINGKIINIIEWNISKETKYLNDSLIDMFIYKTHIYVITIRNVYSINKKTTKITNIWTVENQYEVDISRISTNNLFIIIQNMLFSYTRKLVTLFLG